jgi:hypothetical protein
VTFWESIGQKPLATDYSEVALSSCAGAHAFFRQNFRDLEYSCLLLPDKSGDYDMTDYIFGYGLSEEQNDKMKATDSPLPCSVPFAADTGAVSQATAHYERRLSALRGLYLDSEALEWRIREENDPVCYENYAFNEGKAEGDLFFGTTIIYPGQVGSEYHLTRGHYHRKRDRAETYQALSGRGLVLEHGRNLAACTPRRRPGLTLRLAAAGDHARGDARRRCAPRDQPGRTTLLR